MAINNRRKLLYIRLAVLSEDDNKINKNRRSAQIITSLRLRDAYWAADLFRVLLLAERVQ